jgi:hypothetical protein
MEHMKQTSRIISKQATSHGRGCREDHKEKGNNISDSIKHEEKTTIPIGCSFGAVTAVSASKSWYVVDPENNLAITRATMSAFLNPLADRWRWRGFVGTAPTTDEFR